MNASLSNNPKGTASGAACGTTSWLDPLTPGLAERRLQWHDETQTVAFAKHLANRTGIEQAFVALDGDLGAGKTTLVRNLLQALGVEGRIKSPTYTIMETYALAHSPLQVAHFDFYRFNDPMEWEDAGFRDVFAATGLKLVEWPEKALGLLPQPDLLVRIASQDDASREVTLKAFTPLGLALLP